MSAEPGARADTCLVERAQDGDERAFEALLERHRRLLAGEGARFYLPGADADDVAQEARIGFAKAVAAYRGGRGSSFRTFATMCVRRQLQSALAAALRAKQRPLTDALRGEAAERAWCDLADIETPYSRALARERLRWLGELRGRITEAERLALAHAVVGYSSGETAALLHQPARSLDNALQRARRKAAAWEQEAA